MVITVVLLKMFPSYKLKLFKAGELYPSISMDIDIPCCSSVYLRGRGGTAVITLMEVQWGGGVLLQWSGPFISAHPWALTGSSGKNIF